VTYHYDVVIAQSTPNGIKNNIANSFINTMLLCFNCHFLVIFFYFWNFLFSSICIYLIVCFVLYLHCLCGK